MTKICENCGAEYIESDGYCKNCWKKLSDQDGVIRGIAKSDWEKCIGKNADRYTKIFAENEGKKVFFKLNLAAFFFGFNWMFYRKMYKYAFIHLLITVVFTLLVYGAVYGAYRNDIILYKKLDAQYDAYMNEYWFGEPEYIYNEKGEIVGKKVPEEPDYFDDYRAVLKKLKFFPAFILSVLPLAMNVFLALLADCTYRAHIYRKLRADGATNGGASTGMFFIGVLINSAAEAILVAPILEKLTSFFEFSIFKKDAHNFDLKEEREWRLYF